MTLTQMQTDWRNGRDPIHCFLSVLGYSMYSFIYFTDNLRLETFLDCHMKAFSYYGGITKTALYDNLKSARIESYEVLLVGAL
jgi:transposase